MIYKSIYKSKTSKLILNRFVRLTVASVFGLSLFALAQAAPAAGAATAPDSPSAAAAAASKATGTKVGTINIEQAIFLSNQGQRDFAELAKKFEPKQNDLKAKADEIDSLKKQLAAQQDKLNDAARDKLVKEVETKQKSFDRSTQDAQEDFQAQQGEIGNKILTVMAPLIVKYASDHDYRHHATRDRSVQRSIRSARSRCGQFAHQTRETGNQTSGARDSEKITTPLR